MADSKVQIFDKKTLAEFKEWNSQQGFEGFQPLKRLVKFVMGIALRRAKEEAQKKMVEFDEAKAEEVLNQFVDGIGDGQLWKWFIEGGWKKVLEVFLQVLGIFI